MVIENISFFFLFASAVLSDLWWIRGQMNMKTTIDFKVGFAYLSWGYAPLIARFMGPTWGPSGADRSQVGLMVAPSTFFILDIAKIRYLKFADIILCWRICIVIWWWLRVTDPSFYHILYLRIRLHVSILNNGLPHNFSGKPCKNSVESRSSFYAIHECVISVLQIRGRLLIWIRMVC